MPKIHLLISVYLTNTDLHSKSMYSSNISPNQNKAEQFLSTLHSLKKINFSSADIYFELSEDYEQYKKLIIQQIRSNIPNAAVHLNRLSDYKSWKIASDAVPLESDIVLLKSNHDHVFLPDNAESFYQYLTNLLSYGTDYYGDITHWPESIGNVRGRQWEITPNKNAMYSVTECNEAIGTCVISPTFFASWWQKDFTEGSKIVRPDNPFGPGVKFKTTKRIVPTEEFFRHLDGYSHVGVKAPISASIRACCHIQSNRINHTDWTFGNFLTNKNDRDLPVQVKKYAVNPISTLINQILLASAYKVNLKNIYYISKANEYKGGKLSIVCLVLCLINYHFVRKLMNLFLPVFAGNICLYKIRVKIAVSYQDLRRHNDLLPSSIRNLLLLRLNK